MFFFFWGFEPIWIVLIFYFRTTLIFKSILWKGWTNASTEKKHEIFGMDFNSKCRRIHYFHSGDYWPRETYRHVSPRATCTFIFSGWAHYDWTRTQFIWANRALNIDSMISHPEHALKIQVLLYVPWCTIGHDNDDHNDSHRFDEQVNHFQTNWRQ